MGYFYELIRNETGLPVRRFIHSVNNFQMHIHNEVEILLVLKGSINIRVGNKRYLLKENDIIITNSNEVHSTSKTNEENIILVLQIGLEYYSKYYKDIDKIRFDCKSFEYEDDEQERFNLLREHLATMVWLDNKKEKGYKLKVGSEINLLISTLLNNFVKSFIDVREAEDIERDINRIQNVIYYINENFQNKITLQDVADNESLSMFYTSRIIKDTLGISFQEYLNYKRLNKFIELMKSRDNTITEIAYESGFPSSNSLNRLFKLEFGCTPTEYREKDINDDIGLDENFKNKTYLDVDREAAYKKLFIHLKSPTNKAQEPIPSNNDKYNICVSLENETTVYKKHWKELITFGRAAEGLRKDWQDQFKEMQKEIGFKYIRFHGIFSDDMMVTNHDEKGNIVYNWSYVNKLFDFFIENNIKPFVELGFMPSELKSSDDTMFFWEANISQPKDINQWTDLVKSFIGNCINRYGIREVETWYFEVWNEPSFEYAFWIGGKEQYFEFYKETVLAVRAISKRLKIGGPATTFQSIDYDNWLSDFLIYCNKENITIDFTSIHIYPDDFTSKTEIQTILSKAKEGTDREGIDIGELRDELIDLKRIYFDKNHTSDTLKAANEKLDMHLDYKLELHITEWNASAHDGNLIHDTCFVSTYIIKNMLDSIGIVDSLGYWTFTDVMEEFKVKSSPFRGGFGLINRDGIKKASYFAYSLLSKLGKEIIDKGEGYIVTKTNEDIQILTYNFIYFDNLFLNGDTSALTNEERYKVYQPGNTKEIGLSLEDISGKYKITRYALNRENGSAFDEWIKMGAPENMLEEEINYLKGKARPKITTKYEDIDKTYKEKLYVPIHGAELIVLNKQL